MAGETGLILVPSPSSPFVLAPQPHTFPSLEIAKLNRLPAVMTFILLSPVTIVGVELVLLLGRGVYY
jgi:hypothetical protein